MAEANKSQYAKIEEQLLDLWDKEKTFEKSLAHREGAELFSFYDGPPFANGLPHFGHSLVTSIKDSLGRYKTMRGYYVERRNGWDCHGLPVEFAIEKQFGISGKKQILELGLDKFNAACRDSVFKYKGEWEQFFQRIGRWTDTKNSYATIDRDYTESVWWVLKQVHNKGLLYRGYKSMPYCPRCETPLSNFEVNEGYKDNVSDPSLFVKFKLINEDAYLLGWTTTPWSLPGNAAVAVSSDQHYIYVIHRNEQGMKETLILAKERISLLDEKDYSVVREVSGQELAGKSYEPLFKLQDSIDMSRYNDLYTVVTAPFVNIEDGTGVLHVAPAFGEDDLNLTEIYKLPVFSTVDSSGHLTVEVDSEDFKASGLFFKSADRPIIEYLAGKGLVFAAEMQNHTYPFCYRCETPLLYYAISTWFVKVSAIKKELLKSAESINWVPEHIKQGRFGNWLEGARDWAISRNRYWGAPMPIWVNEADPTDYIVVESVQELQKLSGGRAKLDDLHRPFIDEVVFEKEGKTYRRVEEVLDCWFESGSMPVAQQHYPFENKEKFASSFPADYVGEGLDQTRLWFYVLHVLGTILFDKPAYKNVLVNGMILAADGQKLSKRLNNYPPVEEVFSDEGADSLRLYMLSNYQAVAGEYMRFNHDAMKDLSRNVLGTLLNTLRFLRMYADIDNWQPPKSYDEPKVDHVLDKWILARLNGTITEVTDAADSYKLAYAIQPVFTLIDDMSNWYVRRSRRRFWKSEDDKDKKQAYETLWYVLVNICQLLAPWAPFVSDYVWRELTPGSSLPQSVHLSDWPTSGKASGSVVNEMDTVRGYINQGLAQRAAAGIKVRQPLSSVTIPSVVEAYLEILKEELNVKEVKTGSKEVIISTQITEELKAEGSMRELVRHIQNARKQAGLNVDDRIKLVVKSKNNDLAKVVVAFKTEIQKETLARQLRTEGDHAHTIDAKVDGASVTISLEKADA